MIKNKLKWNGVDDSKIIEPVFPNDKPNYVIALTG